MPLRQSGNNRGSTNSTQWLKYLVLMMLALGLGLTGSERKGHAADDDWESVGSTTIESAPSPKVQSQSSRDRAALVSPQDGAEKPFKVCGELATEPSPQVASMVARINELWGSAFHAYQTVAPEQPHASTGGCVFYNPAMMAVIMSRRLGVQETAIADPLMWAIFAHEIGHQVHRDTEPVRASVPSATKELEADRFAGYTLEKLQIRATDLSPFWSLTGDEFGGGANARNQHGSSSQRLAAFKQGWNLAEWHRPEGSGSVVEAQNESVAPDSADGAPK